jgi:glycosyltransferase involved in cell wall biosynthesis
MTAPAGQHSDGRRVLIVSYYFPPKGGAGTQRFAKFCKFLPEFGIEPVVLAAGDDVRPKSAPTDDPTLIASLPTTVERVPAPRKAPFSLRVRRRLRLHLDDDEWALAAGERALALARECRAEAVVTTLSPYACYRIGERLQQQAGLPWILDLRDPWSLDGWRWFRTGLHARIDLGRMRHALRKADFVIANVPEAKRAYVELGADPARTVVIPNGFDEEDFEGTSPGPASDGRFHLAHMGTLHGTGEPEGLTSNRVLRVRHRQIAPLGRTGHYLLHALALLRDSEPQVYRAILVDLYGKVDHTHRALASRLGVADAVREHGYVAHTEATRALLGADAVFVPLHGVPAGERALVVPGKLYEALASERPVLAALPAGDGADLVAHLQAGAVVPATDAAELARALAELVRRQQRGERLTGCARARLQLFTRRSLTGQLAEVLRAAIGGRTELDLEDPWRRLRIESTVR